MIKRGNKGDATGLAISAKAIGRAAAEHPRGRFVLKLYVSGMRLCKFGRRASGARSVRSARFERSTSLIRSNTNPAGPTIFRSHGETGSNVLRATVRNSTNARCSFHQPQ